MTNNENGLHPADIEKAFNVLYDYIVGGYDYSYSDYKKMVNDDVNQYLKNVKEKNLKSTDAIKEKLDSETKNIKIDIIAGIIALAISIIGFASIFVFKKDIKEEPVEEPKIIKTETNIKNEPEDVNTAVVEDKKPEIKQKENKSKPSIEDIDVLKGDDEGLEELFK